MLYTNQILEKFLAQAERNPHKKIIIETSGKGISNWELSRKSINLALNLQKSGFKKGDRVLVLVRPGIELVIFIIAVMRLGGVIIVTDPGMGKDVFKSRIDIAKPKWIFIESILLAIQPHPIIKLYLRKKGYEIPEITGLDGKNIIRLGWPLPGSLTALSYSTLLAEKSGSDTNNSSKLGDTEEAMIIFTSGTTGMPKGVVHTVRSLSNTIDKISSICMPSDRDVFYASLAHFLLMAVALGTTSILPKDKFSPEDYFRTLDKYQPTVLFGPPAEFIELVNYCKKNNRKFPKQIKKIFLGSAPVLSGFLQKLISHLPDSTQITCIYGMTEVLPVATIDGRIKAQWEGQGDLLGALDSEVKYKLGDNGELLLNTPYAFKSYLGKEKTSLFDTGDLVKFKNKQLILIGRKKDMIIKGNYNIYPELYESTIQKIPGVAACAMVGVRDEDLEDEKIILAIEPEDFTNKNPAQYVMDKIKSGDYSIDTQALPDKVVVMKLPRFGRQSKIDKKRLRDIIQERYL